MLSTILRSTNSGRTGFYEIGKVIESGGSEYTIRSAFKPTFPNGAKPTLLVCTHEFAKKTDPENKTFVCSASQIPKSTVLGIW